jgi:deoxyadenosine/deoxycytidine kinase
MYIVEGNIGVGKSTFLSLLGQNCPEIETVQEPVNDWAKNVSGESLLDSFYKDPKRWSYTLETLTMIYRTRDYIKEQSNTNPNRVMERSVYSGHYCFAYNGFESGFFSHVEWEIYNKWVDFLLRNQCKPPKGFIYLKTSPEVCFERVIKRNRASEKSLSIEVLKKIDHFHDKFLIEKQNVFEELKKIPVLVLDCSDDFQENPEQMQNHIKKVKSFF